MRGPGLDYARWEFNVVMKGILHVKKLVDDCQ